MASGAGSKATDEWAAAAAGASTPPSAGERVDVLMLGGPLLFWLLLLLSLKRLAFQSSKDRKRSSSTGSRGVKGWRRQMGSSEGLGARAAMAWNGSYCVVGGEWLERMGDAKSRQRSKDGSHGNGRVNIESARLGRDGAKTSNSIFISFHIWPRSHHSSKNNIVIPCREHMYQQLAAMFVNNTPRNKNWPRWPPCNWWDKMLRVCNNFLYHL